MAETANRSRGSGRRVRGAFAPKHDAGTATRHYRAFWRRRCRAAAAGAVLEPLGGNCAVLPHNFFKNICSRCKMSGAFFVLVYRSASNKESVPADECERRCGALNQTDFTQLMQQYQKLVYTVCLQFVHNPHTAEDLTQDTFLSAWSSIDRCEIGRASCRERV